MDNPSLRQIDNNRSGQVVLETALIFLAVVALVVGIVKLWATSDSRIAQRQQQFEGSRIPAGSTAPGVHWGAASFNMGEREIFLKFSRGERSFSPGDSLTDEDIRLMTPEELCQYIGELKKNIKDIEKQIPEMEKLIKRAEKALNTAQNGEADARAQVEYWEGQVDYWNGQYANCASYSTSEYDHCAYSSTMLNDAQNQLRVYQEGAVVNEVCYGSEGPECYYTYDFDAWQKKFSTREEFAEDWLYYKMFHYSPKHAGYLHSTYTAGVVDWVARRNEAQKTLDEFTKNLEDINKSLVKMKEAREKIESQLAALGATC